MGKPSVILTSQFTTPKAKSFSTYVNYMTRKEALLESNKDLTVEEEKGLSRIQHVINKYDMEQGQAYLLGNQEADLSEKELEANTILKTKNEFHNETDFSKYISYMSRQYALEKKKNLSLDEEKELDVIRHSISNLPNEKSRSEPKAPSVVKEGVFSIEKDSLTTKDLEQVHNTIKKAQNNGSVFYQDVISFDNDFLIKEKLLNSATNELDEKKIQYASRKMMDSMFKDEKIESGYWFASIHRNTKHIHIHYGTVELKNTRELLTVEEDGFSYLAPKGKRKQKTIDNMKSTFANFLIDRTAELSRISELRNTLVDEIKQTYADKEYQEQKNLLEDIYSELPSNKKHWQYGSKHVTDQTRNKIDKITDSLMRNNSHYKEYLEKTEEESSYRKELFGDTKRADKDYGINKKKDIQKRLGNALLAQMKKQTNAAELMKRNYQDSYSTKNSEEGSYKNKPNYKQSFRDSSYKKPLISRKTMHQLEQAVNDDYAKFRAEKEHEQVQQRIAWEQERNEL
ncbi:MobP2 family relaxase [Niallia sp. MER 6]|uniref:MobP2 family relaxase n=1 Tax=Niallia sp. MER 6 TaxID=2939567 RepID=UPI002040D249|nr:MobP2 family relaxase [Niallia sp. MER 6]MCM3033694.1 relaxase MobL [Niallia sp. MER 6]